MVLFLMPETVIILSAIILFIAPLFRLLIGRWVGQRDSTTGVWRRVWAGQDLCNLVRTPLVGPPPNGSGRAGLAFLAACGRLVPRHHGPGSGGRASPSS